MTAEADKVIKSSKNETLVDELLFAGMGLHANVNNPSFSPTPETRAKWASLFKRSRHEIGNLQALVAKALAAWEGTGPGIVLDELRAALSGQSSVETTGDESPIVEVWRGDRKVTVYRDTVIRVWGPSIDHEMSDEPRTLNSLQAAFDWLYSPVETSGIDAGPTGTVEGLRRYIFEQLGFLCGEDDNNPAEAILRLAAKQLKATSHHSFDANGSPIQDDSTPSRSTGETI
jgi:hypothetical protein